MGMDGDPVAEHDAGSHDRELADRHVPPDGVAFYDCGRDECGDPSGGRSGGCWYAARALSVDDCKLLELPVVHDPQGNLTFIEERRHVPFEISRVYHLYDVPGGAMRGGHAHRDTEEFLVAMSGSFEVIVDDGVGGRACGSTAPTSGYTCRR